MQMKNRRLDKKLVMESIGSTFIQRSTNRAERGKLKQQDNLNKQEFPSEVWFANKLRSKGIVDFEQNVPCGIYFMDFLIRSKSICFEVDGSHHMKDVQSFKDKVKDSYLKKMKLNVIRIPSFHEKASNLAIEQALAEKNNPWVGPISNAPKKKNDSDKHLSHEAWVRTLTIDFKKLYRRLKRQHNRVYAREEVTRLVALGETRPVTAPRG